MKSLFFHLLIVFTIISCKSSDPEPVLTNTFKVGDKDYTFTYGYFDDYGYNDYWDECYREFYLLPSPITNSTNEEDIKFGIFIDAYSSGETFRSGEYKTDWNANLSGDLVFFEEGKRYDMEKGIFRVDVKSNNTYTITIDGIIDDKRPIKGSFSGTFIDVFEVSAISKSDNMLKKARVRR